MSVSVEYSTKEISAIVLTNVLKMCKRRDLINNVNSLFENLNVEFINKGEVEFESKNNNKISIHHFTGKISSIVQNSPLEEYLKNSVNVHKIVVMKEPTKRSAKQIIDSIKGKINREDVIAAAQKAAAAILKSAKDDIFVLYFHR